MAPCLFCGKVDRELCAMPPLWTPFKSGMRVSCKARLSSQQPHFGLELNSDDRIKIICMRSETVNAALPARVSQKKAARQVLEGRLSKICCQYIPELLPN